MAAMGRMYENGRGVAKDPDTAQMWYDKAKATGYTK
jgi:TPR repeat protein